MFPFLSRATTVICDVVPAANVVFDALTVRELIVTVTVSGMESRRVLTASTTTLVPSFTPFTMPLAETLAIVGALDVQAIASPSLMAYCASAEVAATFNESPIATDTAGDMVGAAAAGERTGDAVGRVGAGASHAARASDAADV